MIMLLRKTSMSILLLCCVFFISSCSSDEQNILANTEPNISQEEIAMQNLIDSIDALNEKYPSVQTRGAFVTGGAVGLADAAGWAAGAGIGRWVGGAAGSLGGPATAVLGTFIGGKVGPYVCTFLASGAANALCSRSSTRAVSSNHLEPQLVYVVSNEDSIGYYHNCMMTELYNNRDKYYTCTGSVDFDLMYQDIVQYLKIIGKYDEALDNAVVKADIINQIKSICSISEKYQFNPEDDEFINEQCNYLKASCYLQDAEVNLYRDYSVKLYNKCSTLSEGQIENYSRDLNILIDNSNVSLKQKEELTLTADLTINSALYWNANY